MSVMTATGESGLLCELAFDGGEIVAEEVDDLGCGRDGDRAHLGLQTIRARSSGPVIVRRV